MMIITMLAIERNLFVSRTNTENDNTMNVIMHHFTQLGIDTDTHTTIQTNKV